MRYEIWHFATARFVVQAFATPEECDPRDHFEREDDIAFASDDNLAHWFTALVEVRYRPTNALLGSAVLGCCSYRNFDEFTKNHRDSPEDSRNTLAMKAKKTCVCHYFPSMVAEAVADARKMIAAVAL